MLPISVETGCLWSPRCSSSNSNVDPQPVLSLEPTLATTSLGRRRLLLHRVSRANSIIWVSKAACTVFAKCMLTSCVLDTQRFTIPFVSTQDFTAGNPLRFRSVQVYKGNYFAQGFDDDRLQYYAFTSQGASCVYGKVNRNDQYDPVRFRADKHISFSKDGHPVPNVYTPDYCPQQLCPSRYDPNLTRRAMAAIGARQVDPSLLRKRLVRAVDLERSFRFASQNRIRGADEESEMSWDASESEIIDDMLDGFEY